MPYEGTMPILAITLIMISTNKVESINRKISLHKRINDY